jgi:pimeloyl-ACP methyl ester carboxylesterase
MLTLFLTSLLTVMPADTTDALLPHYPTPVDTVAVDGRSIVYYDSGTDEAADAPPILFVHGLGSNMALWRDALSVFGADHRVLALDLPGFGLSGKEDVPGTMPFFADTIAGFLDALGIERVQYVGVSMGGQIGMTLALERPERIARLALISPAGIEQFSAQEAATLKQLTTPQSIQAADSTRVEQSIAVNFGTWAPRFHWLLDQRFQLAERSDFDQYAEANARSVAGMLDGPVIDRISALKMPVLVLFGAQDKLIPNRYLHPTLTTAAVADSARAALPERATVRLIDDAGHLLMLEQPTAFTDALRGFLSFTE